MADFRNASEVDVAQRELKVFFTAKTVSLHFKTRDELAKRANLCMELPRSPGNIALIRAMAAGPELEEACRAVAKCGNGGARLSREASDMVRKALSTLEDR